MAKDMIKEALEGNEFRFDGMEDELESHPPMVIYDPPAPKKGIAEIDTEQDTKDDYDFARNTLIGILQQQHEALKSMIEFVNGSPSARAYEVLNNMIATAATNSEKLLELQKKVKDLKAEAKPKEKEGSGKVYIYGGGPIDLVEPIDGKATRK